MEIGAPWLDTNGLWSFLDGLLDGSAEPFLAFPHEKSKVLRRLACEGMFGFSNAWTSKARGKSQRTSEVGDYVFGSASD